MSDALMVSSSFLPGRGGIESYLAELCQLLAPRLAVLAAGERDGAPLPGGLGYPTHPYPGTLLFPTPKAARAMVEAAAAESTDRILFGTPWPLVLTGPRLRRAGLRYAVIVHGAEMLIPSATPLVRRKLARALSEAELLLPVSHYTAGKLRTFLERAGLPVPPMELLRARVDLERFHPGIDTTAIRAELGVAPADKMVLCFGRLVKRKGVDRMIAALPEIAKRVPNVVLVVAGTGPDEKRLRALTRRAGIPVGTLQAGAAPDRDEPSSPPTGGARVVGAGPVPDGDAPGGARVVGAGPVPDGDAPGGARVVGAGPVPHDDAPTGARVVFAGRVPDEDAPAVYAAADVFALPVVDRWFGLEIEGLGVVLLEAAACGVPGVTGRSGGTPEAILDGATGFVVDASNRAELADRVQRLLTDEDLAKRFGRAGRAHVEAEFSDKALPQGFLDWLG